MNFLAEQLEFYFLNKNRSETETKRKIQERELRKCLAPKYEIYK